MGARLGFRLDPHGCARCPVELGATPPWRSLTIQVERMSVSREQRADLRLGPRGREWQGHASDDAIVKLRRKGCLPMIPFADLKAATPTPLGLIQSFIGQGRQVFEIA